MSDTQNCPDVTRLQALLDGTLPEESQAAMATHLESCSHCRHQLELLAGGNAVLPQDPAASEHRSPSLEQAMLRLKGEFSEATQTVGETQGAPLSFGFLGRSDNPRHLGRLGGYEILELIGRGGMGIVFKGRDRKLERLVAVKVLSPELASSATARKRFLREAQAAAAVTHEHVVTIHAVDEVDGTPFLVMEYIVGVSLEDRIQRSGHLRVEEILRIGMQAAAGLAAAHAQGLVHRDIKPSNILLENGVERVKITDFGLARVIHEAQSTQSNVVAGTPQYMSPEQARGESVDHRSDLFSLGCVLYAMCVGRSPFRAETPTGAIHRVCEDTPRPICEVNPDIPEWLVAIIDRLLEKKAEDRFQSANEVAEVLGEYLAHVQQPSQVALPAGRRALVNSRRDSLARPGLVATALVTLILVLLGVVAFWPSQQRPAAQGGGNIDGGDPPPPPPTMTVVDIGPWTNRRLTDSPDTPNEGNHLGEFDTGSRVFNAIRFLVGDHYIQLGGAKVTGCPDAVRGIKVNAKAKKLHFLHGCVRGYPGHGAIVAVYRIHYEDATQELFQVISGRHLRNWWSTSTLPDEATLATRAWLGSNPWISKFDRKLQVFMCPWDNPHKEKVISTIDFERGPGTWPAPFCLGITCDPSATPMPSEKGLLSITNAGFQVGNDRYSVAVLGSSHLPFRGKGTHDVLVPPGTHHVEIRDGERLIRRGSVQIVAGGRVDINLDSPHTLFPLPEAQPQMDAELSGHDAGVWDVDLSRDGKTLVTAAHDGKVILWRKDDSTWKKMATIESHPENAVRAVALSPSAERLATTSIDGSLKIWDVASAALVLTLKQDKIGVFSAAYSPTGQLLASGSGNGTVDIWDTASHSKIASFQACTGIVHDIKFSPDATLLAVGSWTENAVKLWDTATWKVRHTLIGHTGPVAAVAFSPDGKVLASASADSTVRLWSVESGESLRSFGSPKSLFCLAFSPDGRRIAAGGRFHTIRIWDVESHRVIHDFQAHWGEIRSLAFTPDGTRLITASHDNTVRVWPTSSLPGPFQEESEGLSPIATFDVYNYWVPCAVFIPSNGNKLAAVGGGGLSRFEVWDLTEYKHVVSPAVGEKATDTLWSLAVTPDATTMITTMWREGPPLIGLWDITTDRFRRRAAVEPVSMSEDKGGTPARLALSHDGNLLAVTSYSRISVYDLKQRSWRSPFTSDQGNPVAVEFLADNRRLAVGTDLGRVLIVDAITGEEVAKPLEHGSESVTAMASSSAGILTSADKAGTVKMWDQKTFQCIPLPASHLEKVFSAGFSPDGNLLATAGGGQPFDNTPWTHQGEVCLWDVTRRELLTKFRSHYGCVTGAVFSPDGKSLATTGRDGKMHLWDVEQLLKWQEKQEAK